MGWLLLAGAIAAFGLVRLCWPEWSGAVLSHAVSHVFTGRGGGVIVGRAHGVSLVWSVVISSTMDMLVVFNLFPLIVRSYKRHVEFRLFGGALKAAMEAGQMQHKRVGKFGVLGIMLFVWFPFAMTGPLIGSLIGLLIGLRVWVNMAVVMVGTILAAVSWALAYEKMARLLEGLHYLAPFAVVCAILVVLVLTRAKTFTRRRPE